MQLNRSSISSSMQSNSHTVDRTNCMAHVDNHELELGVCATVGIHGAP
jgi:hypothetical protein